MKKIMFGILGIITIFLCIGVFKKDLIIAYYEDYKLHNNYKSGDDIKTNNAFSQSIKNAPFFRLVKNDADNYGFVTADLDISGDSLRKYKTNVIGKFVSKKFLPYSFSQKVAGRNLTGIVTLYEILPNLKISNKTIEDAPPSGYKYADDKYYIVKPLIFVLKPDQ